MLSSRKPDDFAELSLLKPLVDGSLARDAQASRRPPTTLPRPARSGRKDAEVRGELWTALAGWMQRRRRASASVLLRDDSAREMRTRAAACPLVAVSSVARAELLDQVGSSNQCREM